MGGRWEGVTRNQPLNQWGRCGGVEAFAAYGLIGRVCQDVALGEVQIQTFMVNELSAAAVTVGGVSQGEGKDSAPAAAAAAAKGQAARKPVGCWDNRLHHCIQKIMENTEKRTDFVSFPGLSNMFFPFDPSVIGAIHLLPVHKLYVLII